MNKRNFVSTLKDDEKSKVYINPNESATKILAEKLAYHEKQMLFHKREASQIYRIMELMEKYGITNHSPGTVGAFSEEKNQVNDEAISFEEIRHRIFWKKKTVEYIVRCGILVRASDIFMSIGAKISTRERRSIMSTLSLALADLCNEGALKKFNVEGVKGYYYGTPEMFNGENPIVEF